VAQIKNWYDNYNWQFVNMFEVKLLSWGVCKKKIVTKNETTPLMLMFSETTQPSVLFVFFLMNDYNIIMEKVPIETAFV